MAVVPNPDSVSISQTLKCSKSFLCRRWCDMILKRMKKGTELNSLRILWHSVLTFSVSKSRHPLQLFIYSQHYQTMLFTHPRNKRRGQAAEKKSRYCAVITKVEKKKQNKNSRLVSGIGLRCCTRRNLLSKGAQSSTRV